MTRRKGIALGVAFVMLAAAAGAVYVLLRPEPFSEPPLPVPNGYDDLLAASQQISGVVPDLEKASPNELSDFAERNAPALERARIGLDRECRVPIAESPQYVNASINRAQAIRKLLRLFLADGRVARQHADHERARAAFSDAVLLGSKAAHGGLMIDAQIGIACESSGLRELQPLIPDLSKEQCAELIAMLDGVNAGREPWENVERREWALFRNTAPLGVRLTSSISPTVRQMAEQGYRRLEELRKKTHARLRLLIVRLALQAYYLDHEVYPEMLSALVPDYLDEVPEDPLSGDPLVYTRTEQGYDLGSIGDSEADESPDTAKEISAGIER